VECRGAYPSAGLNTRPRQLRFCQHSAIDLRLAIARQAGPPAPGELVCLQESRSKMRDFLLAIVFLAGTVLLLGGCLYHDKLLSVEGAAIGFGAVLCVLASIAKDRIDRDMIL